MDPEDFQIAVLTIGVLLIVWFVNRLALDAIIGLLLLSVLVSLVLVPYWSIKPSIQYTIRRANADWRVAVIGIGVFSTIVILTHLFGNPTTTCDRVAYTFCMTQYGWGIALVSAGIIGLPIAAGNVGHYWRVRNADQPETSGNTRDSILLTGEIHPGGEPLVAPLSGRDTVCYRCQQNRRDTSWLRKSDWYTAAIFENTIPFVVTDGQTRTHIDPTGADLDIENQKSSPDDELLITADEAIPQSLKALFPDATGPPRSDQRYQEKRLEPYDEVCIIGKEKPNQEKYSDRTVADVAMSALLISERSRHSLEETLRRRVIGGGILSGIFTIGGYSLMIIGSF